MKKRQINTLIFDWGDTIMVDNPNLTSPMCDWENITFVPNAEYVVSKLACDYKLIVASNAGVSDAIKMKKAFERVGISKFFNSFYTSKELGSEKPNVLFFENILKNIGGNAKEFVMIGNSYEKDIIGAKKIGINTIFYNPEFYFTFLFRRDFNKFGIINMDAADVVINNLIYLPETLKSINKTNNCPFS